MSSRLSDSVSSRSRFACACTSRTFRRTSCLDSILAIVANLRPPRRQALTVAATFPAAMSGRAQAAWSQSGPHRGPQLCPFAPCRERWLCRPGLESHEPWHASGHTSHPPYPQKTPLPYSDLPRADAGVAGTASTRLAVIHPAWPHSVGCKSATLGAPATTPAAAHATRRARCTCPLLPVIPPQTPALPPNLVYLYPHLTPDRTSLTPASPSFRTAAAPAQQQPLSRPADDCDGYAALAAIRKIGLDDPSPVVQIHLAISVARLAAARSFQELTPGVPG